MCLFYVSTIFYYQPFKNDTERQGIVKKDDREFKERQQGNDRGDDRGTERDERVMERDDRGTERG